MSSVFAVVPVKEPRAGKSRLAPLLGESEREALNLVLARHTLSVCADHFGPGRTVVVTSSPAVEALARGLGLHVRHEPPDTGGLNAALALGAAFALDAGAEALAVVPTDMPLLTAEALALTLGTAPRSPFCLVVPDRHETGTNLLCMSPIDPRLFSFGEPSFERHGRRARELGYTLAIRRNDALAFDLDLPEDYQQLRNLSPWISRSTTQTPSASRSASIPT